MGFNTADQLEHHWALDSQAAQVLAEQIEKDGQTRRIEMVVEQFDAIAIERRDQNRDRMKNIFTRASKAGFITLGPCSIDDYSDYGALFDYIGELQETYPDDQFAIRLNNAKPRTAGDWTGMWYSLDRDERAAMFNVYQRAVDRGIAVVTEMTQETQLGALAPWLSGYWLGARDMPSSTLRTVSSVYHLAVGVKNGIDGNPKDVANAVKVIRSNSADNRYSGADLGTVAATADFRGLATGVLPVAQGSQEVAVFARGYPLPEDMTARERRTRALEHLSRMCTLGAQLGCAVVIDGTHDVPPMFDIDKKDPDRIIPVMQEFNRAVADGSIRDAHHLAGVIAEVSTSEGFTDPNYVLDTERKRQLGELVAETVLLLAQVALRAS
ncbi:hypothetical protein HY441_02590 [Candidatus Microgenomates bacterium]|nr:hypothetical protein [Candidatus Microgenomates bacterium]